MEQYAEIHFFAGLKLVKKIKIFFDKWMLLPNSVIISEVQKNQLSSLLSTQIGMWIWTSARYQFLWKPAVLNKRTFHK